MLVIVFVNTGSWSIFPSCSSRTLTHCLCTEGVSTGSSIFGPICYYYVHHGISDASILEVGMEGLRGGLGGVNISQ